MPAFTNPAVDADELREAVRAVAHATRRIDDPAAIYSVIGSISASLASLAQVLHRLGAAHDPKPRATSYRAPWELHRAGEMLTQVSEVVDRAHQREASITYDVHLPVTPAPTERERGLCL